MQLRPSMRRAAKMRLALAGASGSGKTYSSLLIAYGMTSDWSRVAVIDSESRISARSGSRGPRARSTRRRPRRTTPGFSTCMTPISSRWATRPATCPTPFPTRKPVRIRPTRSSRRSTAGSANGNAFGRSPVSRNLFFGGGGYSDPIEERKMTAAANR